LFALGRQQEALEASQEVVDIQRKLAAERPDVFNSMLEASLHVLAQCLRHLGRDEDALPLMTEIQKIHYDEPTDTSIDSLTEKPRFVEIIDTSVSSHVSSQPAEEPAQMGIVTNDDESQDFPSAEPSEPSHVTSHPPEIFEIGEHSDTPDMSLLAADAIPHVTSIAEWPEQSSTSTEWIGGTPQIIADDTLTEEAINPTKKVEAILQSVEVAVQTNEPNPITEAVGAVRPTIKLSMQTTNPQNTTNTTWQLELPAHLRREELLIILLGPFAIVIFYYLITRISLTVVFTVG